MMNAEQQAHVVRALHTLPTQSLYGEKKGARFVDAKVVYAGPMGPAVSAKVEFGAQAWDNDAAPPLVILVVPGVTAPPARAAE